MLLTISEKLTELRVGKKYGAKGITRGWVARWAGVTRAYVWQVEAGKRPPSDRLLVVYVDRCGGDMDELVRLRLAARGV